MSHFQFNYSALEQRGYEIGDDGRCINVHPSKHAEPVLSRELLNAIYKEVSESMPDVNAGLVENVVDKFACDLVNLHIWNIAVEQFQERA